MPRIQAAWSRAQQQTSRRRNAQARLLEPVGAAPRSLPSLARWRAPPVVAGALAWPTKAFFMAASRRCRFFSAASSSSLRRLLCAIASTELLRLGMLVERGAGGHSMRRPS